MARKQKERVDLKFLHHYLIPISLCVLIIIFGIIMTLTNTYDIGYYKHKHLIVFTGPAAIGTGILAALFIVYVKRKK